MPCPSVWESFPSGMAKTKVLPSLLPKSILHVVTHTPFPSEDVKQRLSLSNTEFRIFSRNNEEAGANSDLMIKEKIMENFHFPITQRQEQKMFQTRTSKQKGLNTN